MNFTRRVLFQLMGMGAATAVVAKMPALPAPAQARQRVASQLPLLDSNATWKRYSGFESLDITDADAFTDENEYKQLCRRLGHIA